MCAFDRGTFITLIVLAAACYPSLGGIGLGVPVYDRHEAPPCPYEVAAELELVNTYTGLPPERAEQQQRWKDTQEREIRKVLEETQADAVFLRDGGGPLTTPTDTLQFIHWTEPGCPAAG